MAAVIWAAWSVGIGAGAGHLFEGHHPLVGAAVGVTGGLLIGLAVEGVLPRLLGTGPSLERRGRQDTLHARVLP